MSVMSALTLLRNSFSCCFDVQERSERAQETKRKEREKDEEAKKPKNGCFIFPNVDWYLVRISRHMVRKK
mgnify:CR=1 FL=1